ncbi:hypothetical protein [Pseudomonas aeruginosa]|uniref:hypothetical protein n=1 Tax=Pseudomonas aeruginosa TaxID=287 RepID=UPI000AF704CB|nr:hypothetical protein [Pseudomonas aeruginosa]
MATAAVMCKPHASASAQARSWKPGRRRQGCGRLANASPVRDERTANLEERGPRSGDAKRYFAYYSLWENATMRSRKYGTQSKNMANPNLNYCSEINQALSLLKSISKNRESDFSGTGLIFYSDLSELPFLQLENESIKPNAAIFSDCEIDSAICQISKPKDPLHDGFHFIDIETWKITHVSQFISPPIPNDAAQRFRGTGSRLMSAYLASLITGIKCAGIVSQAGKVHLFHTGADIAGEK